jgi:hypothetical protein
VDWLLTALLLGDAAPVKVESVELDKLPEPLLGLVKPVSISVIATGACVVTPAGRVTVAFAPVGDSWPSSSQYDWSEGP